MYCKKIKHKEKATNFGVKIINDPIYGGISLSTLELELISTPIFQRLRNLKQLAHINYVFPTAEHSRFSHSLGVLHVMGRMADKLYQDKKIDIDDVVYLRVAALLHDIGHYPLSHLGETVYSYSNEEMVSDDLLDCSVNENDKSINKIDGVDHLYLISSYNRKSAHHEKLGSYIINKHDDIQSILNEYNINPAIIGGTVTGEIGSINMIYSQLLHSSLDADRMDYLLRDSYQTGVKYGLVDYEYVIRLLKIKKSFKIDDNGEKDIVVWNKKGQHVLEHFLTSRYFHYSQVVGHKTSLAFEAIIKAMYIRMMSKGRLKYNNYIEIQNNINDPAFLQFNDSMLYEAFHEYHRKENDQIFDLYYDCFTKRIRPKTVYEIKALYRDEEPKDYAVLYRELKKNPQDVQEIIGVKSYEWGYYEFPITIEKLPSIKSLQNAIIEKDDEALREAIKVIDADETVSFLAADNLSIISKIAEYKTKILRIFVIDNDNALDIEKIRRDIDNFISVN